MGSRMLQIDASRLDIELMSIVLDQFNSVLGSTPPRLRNALTAHLKPLIPAAISLGSLITCGATPGMDALGLQFSDVGRESSTTALLGKLSAFAMLHVLLPALWSRLHMAAAAQGWNRLSATPSRKRAWSLILNADKAACAASLINLVIFLRSGRYPTLAHRVTGQLLCHTDPNQVRQVNFEYLNQQLIWGELQQFVMFLLPLLTPGSTASNPLLANLIDPVVKRMAGSKALVKQRSRNSRDKCCLCETERILIAVETKCCASRCCYVCAQRHKQLSARPYCPSCGAAFEEVFLQPLVVKASAGDWKGA
eukprot:jgi/Ulvmu1/1714/UM116_0027.1